MTDSKVRPGRPDLLVGQTAGYLGQALAAVIALTTVGGEIYLIANDKEIGGLAAVITHVAALVASFITGRIVDASKRRAENDSE